MAVGTSICLGKGQIRSVAILIDPIVGDVDCVRMDTGIIIVTVIGNGAA